MNKLMVPGKYIKSITTEKVNTYIKAIAALNIIALQDGTDSIGHIAIAAEKELKRFSSKKIEDLAYDYSGKDSFVSKMVDVCRWDWTIPGTLPILLVKNLLMAYRTRLMNWATGKEFGEAIHNNGFDRGNKENRMDNFPSLLTSQLEALEFMDSTLDASTMAMSNFGMFKPFSGVNEASAVLLKSLVDICSALKQACNPIASACNWRSNLPVHSLYMMTIRAISGGSIIPTYDNHSKEYSQSPNLNMHSLDMMMCKNLNDVYSELHMFGQQMAIIFFEKSNSPIGTVGGDMIKKISDMLIFESVCKMVGSKDRLVSKLSSKLKTNLLFGRSRIEPLLKLIHVESQLPRWIS